MKIASTQFTLKYNALEIYLSGCCGDCNGCHNPELKNFNVGQKYIIYLPTILHKISKFENLIENIWILGGEPLDQNIDELLCMMHSMKKTGKKIWLFTRFELDRIDEDILNLCDFVKTGKYDEKLKCNDNTQFGIQLATSNQKIIKVGYNDKT